ncbi:DUF4142 domain-containing protein [Blastomonas sp.]|uniref:DUF4142 domain-containing protein n=1 Tax=Blastomonas sp. TaxID=1909299 RepID=UPI003593AA67
MRSLIIVASALLVVSCDATNDRSANQNAADDSALEDAAPGSGGDTGMVAEQNLPTATYVARAAMSDLYEIQSGQLAVNKGNSDETRSFGRMMIADHSQSSRDMKTALGQAKMPTDPPTMLDAEHQAMLEKLNMTQGHAFDTEYMAQQMTAHRKALALHQSYSANGETTQLRAFAQKVAQVVAKHHDHLDKIDGNNPAASRSGSTMSQPGQMDGRSNAPGQAAPDAR